LIWAAIETVLDDAATELQKRNAGAMLEWKHSDAREIVRTAATLFARRHAWAGPRFSPVDIMSHGVYDLFDAASIISSTPYEQREGVGDLIITDKPHQAVDIAIQFDRPVPIIKHRRVRKLLQMCSADIHLLSDAREVYGLGKFHRERYDATAEDVFVVKFVRHHCWELCHLDTELMRVEYGQAALPKRSYNPAAVDAALGRTFPSIEDEARTSILDLVACAADAAHGTMFVISQSAPAEGRRLANGGTIKPFSPTDREIKAASAIDGAILVDVHAICHGIGIILDGKAGDSGDASRGARYNSAIRYLSQHSDCVILVVSEDRTVDILDRTTIEVAQTPESKSVARQRRPKKVKKGAKRGSARRRLG
jgi:DNA integrity scanning protein DisA with diadenylate cyclase activity